MKLVISDADEGFKAAVSKVFKATWQRCRVHFMRNAMAHAGKGQRTRTREWRFLTEFQVSSGGLRTRKAVLTAYGAGEAKAGKLPLKIRAIFQGLATVIKANDNKA